MSFVENLSLQFSAWVTGLVRCVFVAAYNGIYCTYLNPGGNPVEQISV